MTKLLTSVGILSVGACCREAVGLHHLRITVTDLARTRAFYREDVLGFTVVAESPGDPNDPEVRNDPAQL